MLYVKPSFKILLKKGRAVLPAVLLVFCILPVKASNLSDATELKKKCEAEIKILEIALKNFGDISDQEQFAGGQKMLKLGKVKFAQSKYPEAIEKYKSYLKLQHNIYASLSEKYIKRTNKMIDEISEDQADNIDNQKVAEYLRLATQNLNDAKSERLNKNYRNSIDLCRTAKNFALSTYKITGKAAPGKYAKDTADIKRTIFK